MLIKWCIGLCQAAHRCWSRRSIGSAIKRTQQFKIDMWDSLVAKWWRVHLQCRRHGFCPWVRKIPWRRKWQPSPVFLPGESYGWRSLVGPSGRKRVRHNLATKQHWHIYITNIYAPNIRGHKVTQIVTDLKGEIDNNQ